MDTLCHKNKPQHVKSVEDTPLTIERILGKRPSLNNRGRQFFGSTYKTMEQLLNDGDTT